MLHILKLFSLYMYKEDGSSPRQMVKTLFSGWVGVGETEGVGVAGVLVVDGIRLQAVASKETTKMPSPNRIGLILFMK
jgi:hypothetical protein